MTDINKEYEKEYYDEYRNNYYNPDDDDGEPGINLNWKRIQKGFHNVAGNDTETAETLSGMRSNLETLNTDVEDLETDVDDIKESIDDLNTAVETAEQAAEAAAASEAAAEAAQAAIEEIAESIPEDYSELSDDVAELKSDLSESTKTDIVKNFDVVIGEQVLSTTGAISSNDNAARSDYISLNKSTSFEFSNVGYLYNYVFFDSEKNYVSGSTVFTDPPYTIPVTAAYVMFCGQKDNVANKKLTLYNAQTVIAAVYEAIGAKADAVSVFGEMIASNKTLLQNVVGVSKFPGNLIKIDDCVNNAYVSSDNGDQINGQPNYFATGFIEVTAGSTYKANLGRSGAWYNANKVFISGIPAVQIQSGVTAPENAAYVRFSVNKTTDGISSPIYLYLADTDDYSTDVLIENLVSRRTTLPWCYGKKVNWIGDSIVAGDDFDEYVTNALGLIETDYGINGSTIGLNGDGTNARNAICSRYSSMSDTADIIIVSAGTNDFQYSWAPFGDLSSTDNTTFYGALKILCEGLIAKYPTKLILFTTPIKRAQPFDGETDLTDNFSQNDYGKTLRDYCNAIKEVCSYYSIPVLDLWSESGLNPGMEAQYNLFDNYHTHPLPAGQKMMARRVCGWLSQISYDIP